MEFYSNLHFVFLFSFYISERSKFWVILFYTMGKNYVPWPTCQYMVGEMYGGNVVSYKPLPPTGNPGRSFDKDKDKENETCQLNYYSSGFHEEQCCE